MSEKPPSPESQLSEKTPEEREAILRSPEFLADCATEALAQMRALPSRLSDDREGSRAQETLAYHSPEHPDDVTRRTRKILDVCKQIGIPVSHKEERFGLLAAMFHDVVQEFKVVEEVDSAYPEFKKLIRKRPQDGSNERRSADALIAFVGEKYPGVLTDEDEKSLRATIQATQVYFNKDEQALASVTVDSDGTEPLLEHALSFADLGAAGMDGPEKFLTEGNALFREEQLDIQDAIYDLTEKPGTVISERQKEFFKQRMLKWSEIQVQFAQGQQKDTNREIEGLLELIENPTPEKIIAGSTALKQVLELGFETSITATTEKLAQRQNMTFEELAADFGYQLPAVA